MTEPCDHSKLEEYGIQERRELHMKEESVDCPGCGQTFIPRLDHFRGDVYLIKEEVA